MRKVIIAGGREYSFTLADKRRLDNVVIDEVVSGRARGADRCGEDWAKSKGIPIKPFPADWERYGRHGPGNAGAVRNKKMAEYADAVVLFPGGSGTEDMRRQAQIHGLAIYDFSLEPLPWTDSKGVTDIPEGSVVVIRRMDRPFASTSRGIEITTHFRPDWVGHPEGYGEMEMEFLLIARSGS